MINIPSPCSQDSRAFKEPIFAVSLIPTLDLLYLYCSVKHWPSEIL